MGKKKGLNVVYRGHETSGVEKRHQKKDGKGELQKRFDAFIRHKHIREFISEKLATTLSDVVSLIIEDVKKDFPKKQQPEDWRGNKPPAEYDGAEVDKFYEEWFISGKQE